MADAGVELHILQRVAGHQDPAVTPRYLHPDVQAMLEAGASLSAWWSPAGPRRADLAVVRAGHGRSTRDLTCDDVAADASRADRI